jgi:indole-3-glycerol phosphate synthase
LTDGPGFGGSLEDLSAVTARVGVPVLRKDFVLDRYQLLEAKLHGADVALLIVAALAVAQLRELCAQARELGLETLVEVHDEAELDLALKCGGDIVGINNRNLKTFEVDLGVTERLLARVAPGTRVISESGVKAPEHIARLRRAGAANFLVGEALVRASDASELLGELLEA